MYWFAQGLILLLGMLILAFLILSISTRSWHGAFVAMGGMVMLAMCFEVLRVERRRRKFPMAAIQPSRRLSKAFMFTLGIGAIVGGGAGLLQGFGIGDALLLAGGLLLVGDFVRGLRT